MDCMMPVMDGFKATQAIREIVDSQECTIVALSAMTHKADIEKGA
jgi:CheY-like chemotaxis protein